MSLAATARIRRFSLLTAAAGVLVIAAIVSVTAFELTNRLSRPSYAWMDTAPRAATSSDGGTTWSAPASAYIEIPDSLGPGPFALSLTSGGPVATVELSAPGAAPGGPAPPLVGILSARSDRTPLLVLASAGARVWITVSTGSELNSGAWTVTLTPTPTTEVTDPVTSGRGDAVLRYAGTALAGTVQQTGTGLLGVDLLTSLGEPQTFTATGDASVPLIWPREPYTVIRIRSESQTASWTLRLDPGAETRQG